MSEDVVPVALPDQESRDVLTRVILPACTSGAVPQDQPVVVIVGGQPGAGKTEIADLVQAALDRRGGAVRICRDLYKAAHQRYGMMPARMQSARIDPPHPPAWPLPLPHRGYDCVSSFSRAA
ncbi:zeta toxin family protein [Streptomyces platensis]|uniref:zeta toxin family protein n=1 Tax=Streptomyces platensis TaxID=58346 RepID=UPI002E13CF16|nr:zeta toxin family protein [Streptomyces platensis]WSI60038.1 zeta toxin family protein [Streptomyces platensis]WTI56771.1 zeta toxin family protein [Streptomyces platensis]WUB84546.1 zeta toxin family protein [Streptomyces platensis]